MTAVNNIYRYSMYCVDEKSNVLSLLSSPGKPSPPTVCPNNAAHIIANNSVVLAKVTYGDESNAETGETNFCSGTYNIAQKHIAISASPVTIVDVISPINTCLFEATFTFNSNNIDDFVSCEMGPDTPAGPLAQDVTIGEFFLYLSPFQLQKLHNGLSVSLVGAEGKNDMGRIITVDWVNSGIQCESPTTTAFAALGSMLLVTAKLGMIEIDQVQSYTLGAVKPTGSKIPAGATLRFKYFNTNGGDGKYMTYSLQTSY